MICYNCGAELDQSMNCPNCGIDVKIYKKIVMASNAYYNIGLEKANVRDLSGAIESLKISLRFNKRNTDARNLLGLVYCEMGEVVAALTEWVISKNYQPKNNRADYYLNATQQNKGKLESINQTIKKYNQALLYCKQGSRDMAILQLKKVLSLNPKLVAGHQLLALLYIQDKKFELAKKSLRNAGKIDVNNKLTLRYLKEVNSGLREQSGNKKPKKEELVSYQSGNETIIQPRYLKDTSAFGTILNLIIGIGIGVAITAFLIVPGVKNTAQQEANKAVVEANNTISSRNQTIATLESEIEALSNQITDMQIAGEDVNSQVNSYAQLLLAYRYHEKNEVDSAGTALGEVREEHLNEAALEVYKEISAEVNKEYLEILFREGYNAYNNDDFETAIASLSKTVELDESYQKGNALYYLAQAYRKSEDLESAKPYYQRFIELFPNTERAATAARYLEE